MSFGLNTAFTNNIQAFLQAHAFTSAMMSSQHYAPPLGVSARYDFLRSDVANDTSVTLYHSPPIGGNIDPLITAYWLPQGGYIDVPINAPLANYIFTPELSGCKIYTDDIGHNTMRVFHIQCPHEAREYTLALRGNRLATIDDSDYGLAIAANPLPNRIASIRANVLLRYSGGHWHFWLQGLTGIGPGMQGDRLVRPPGPAQGVAGVESKLIV
ncbi:hypothetical protein [Jeongeupia chitinilytica]|uniref:Uncharacterized protein n=1 Tax=Jeongeupia chitinilytica TaxID=1041641 RepID=A0ABQ3GWS4_9NEIS|nr:hypothetical protein [Jeongeupia chitinilytica]GHD56171.1 hypothetical protein GCM10007350_02740 [Jeongeupia chitinilytica]